MVPECGEGRGEGGAHWSILALVDKTRPLVLPLTKQGNGNVLPLALLGKQKNQGTFFAKKYHDGFQKYVSGVAHRAEAQEMDCGRKAYLVYVTFLLLGWGKESFTLLKTYRN